MDVFINFGMLGNNILLLFHEENIENWTTVKVEYYYSVSRVPLSSWHIPFYHTQLCQMLLRALRKSYKSHRNIFVL